MAFPEDPLGLRVEIKTGPWTDITSRVYTRDPITHTRGIRQGGATADFATVPLTINNRDGRFSPRNPMSPYYGLIGRNTPVRLWIPDGPHFLDLDGTSGSYASTPDASALTITADLDVRVDLSASWYASGTRTVIGQWTATGNQRSWLLQIVSGVLYLYTSVDGAVTSALASRPLPALPPRAVLRVTLDSDNGAGGRTVRFYWAESLAGAWTEFAAPVTSTGTWVPFNSTAPLGISPPAFFAIPGRVYGAEVRNGINGTTVANPDFTAQPLGTAGFADGAGRTWSVSGTAAVADRRELFVGEIAEWPQKWVASGADVWTPVQAAGILRRYNKGVKALDSTLRRRIPSGNPVAYWPMEEDRYATRAYSPVKGVNPASLTGVEWASLDTLPSSKPLPKIAAGSQLSAIVPSAAAGQWQVEFVYNADDKAPSPANPWVDFIGVSSTGTVRRWVVGMHAGNIRLYGFNAAGTDIVFRSVTVEADVFHGWVRLRLWARDNGSGGVDYSMAFQDVGGDAGGIGGTIASSSAGYVTAVTGTWTDAMEGWGIGHLSVLPTAGATLYNGSDNGYAGETAWARIQRLGSEEGFPIGRIAGPLETQQVGPQRPQTLLSLLQEAADADGGMLVEDRTRLGLVYRDRSSLYTQEPALVLDYAAGQIAANSLEPVDDDSMVRNDITVTRSGGSSARAVLEEGPLSVQDPPAGIGLYDEAITLNLSDDLQPEYIAPWRLHLRTYDGALYPSLTVRLHKHPELIDDVLRLREGDIIRLLHLPSWVAYGPVDLLLTGLSETYLPRMWEITLTCELGGPWMVAQADHAVYGKANTDGSELASPVTESATTVPVRITAGSQWTTDPAEMPIDVQASGEIMRVSAIAARNLGVNPRFAVDLAGWSGQAAGITRTTAANRIPPGAIASMQVAPDGVAVSGGALCTMSGGASVVPGRSYTASGWFFTASGWSDLRPCIDWADAGSAFLSSSLGSGSAVAANTWTFLTQTVTAPASADRATLRARHGGTPPVTATYYVWDLRLGAEGEQDMTVERSRNGVVKSHAAGEPFSLAYPAIVSL